MIVVLIMEIFGGARRLAVLVAAVVFVAACSVAALAAGALGAVNESRQNPDFSPVTELVNANSDERITATAVSGDMVFAGAPNSTLTFDQQGAVFAYRQPTSGWSGRPEAVATLVASSPEEADGLGGVVAAAGATVVSGASRPVGSGRVEVFSKPVNGWSGTVLPSAALSPPPGVQLFDPQIEGNVVVALGAGPTELTREPEVEVYVFIEPAGGWSGSLSPTAELQVPSGDGLAVTSELGGVAVSPDGSEIVAGSAYSAAAYVFTEPVGGWSGSETPTATLTVNPAGTTRVEPLPGYGEFVTFVDGSVVADQPASGEEGTSSSSDAVVFSEPASGWADEGPTAELSDEEGRPNGSAPMLFSASTLLVPVMTGVGANADSTTNGYAVFDLPAGGFSGAVRASATLEANTPALINASFDGPDVIAGAANSEGLIPEPTSSSADAGTIAEGTGGDAEVFANVAQASGPQQPVALLHPPLSTDAAVAVYQEPATGWRSTTPLALLGAPGYASPSILTPVSAQGADIAVEWNDGAPGGAAPANSGDLYTQPAAGWDAASLPTKVLRDTAGSSVSDVQFFGRFGVGLVGDAAVVLQEPEQGWAGEVRDTATFPLPRDRFVQGFTLTSTALVIGLSKTSAGRATWEVIARPARGWSGRLSAAATLAETPAGENYEVASSGGDVVVGGLAGGPLIAANATSSVNLYARPERGWSGKISPAVTLTAPFKGVWLWTRPVSGWREHEAPSAHVTSNRLLPTSVSSISNTGAAIAIRRVVSDVNYTAGSSYADQIWVLDEPTKGWQGTLSGTARNETPLIYAPGFGELDGNRLIVAGQNAQDVGAVFVEDITGTFPANVISSRT